jgi:CheY-like chemotaxis protein
MTGGRLLVVDDDKQNVRVLCDIFTMRGWNTTGAYSGIEAVAAAQSGDFAAVLMDIKMPAMNGVEAMRAIRSRKPATRVILMTAYSAGELVAQAIEEGAMRVVPKPVAIPDVLGLLNNADDKLESN